MLKGREWKTDWRNASGLALREVDHSFTTQWYLRTVYDLDGYIDYPAQEPPYSVLWGIVNGASDFSPPYGTVVQVRM